MFDRDEFVARCVAAGAEDEPRTAVRDVLASAVATPDAMAEAFAPTEGGLSVLYESPELTVLHVVWAPGMRLYPHDHRMWAAIAIYAGREDNAFYRRAGPERRHLTESGGRRASTGDVLLLGADTIHSVANPGTTLTGAIHVYGGDFVRRPRSQWGPGEQVERPYDFDELRGQFALANDAWRATLS